MIFGLANPAALAFWSESRRRVVDPGTTGPVDLGWFLLAFLGGVLVWALSFSSLASVGRRYARPRVFRAIDAACGAVIGFFGIRLVWTSVRRLVGGF